MKITVPIWIITNNSNPIGSAHAFRFEDYNSTAKVSHGEKPYSIENPLKKATTEIMPFAPFFDTIQVSHLQEDIMIIGLQ